MKKITPFLLLLCCAKNYAQWNTDLSLNNLLTDTVGLKQFITTCSDGSGGAIAAWYDSRASKFADFYDVFLQRVDANGNTQWSRNGISLNVSSGGIDKMDMVEDGVGGAVVCFVQGSGTSLNIFAQRINASGQKVWNNGNPVTVCNAANAQFSPRIAATGNQTFVITWQDERAGANADDIYAQKLNGNGQPLWTANGAVVNAALNNQEEPQVVSAGNGETIFCWKDNRSGTNLDVYAQLLNTDGVRQWVGTDNLLSGRIISNAAANQNFPKMCTDGSNGAIIAWQDFRNGATNSTDIYAQRISSAGSVQWTANGVVLCNTTNTQAIEGIQFTGDGAVVCWLDYASDVLTADVFAQKVDLAGTPKWTSNGISICTAANQQSQVSFSTDGNRGAIFCWTDNRADVATRTIYTQRADSSGNLLWGNGGTQVTTAADSKTGPQLVNNGCSAIFVWCDYRRSNNVSGTVQVDVAATRFNCLAQVSNEIICNWLGSISSNWNTAANWSCGNIPGATTAVVVPAGTPFQLVVENQQVSCKGIKVESGATVQVKGSGKIDILQ